MTTGGRPGGRQRGEGFTLVELLVALVLGVLLLGAAIQLFGSLSRAVEAGIVRSDRMDALRTAWITVEREVRPGLPGRDWHLTPDGALELRGFRGIGRVCPGEPEPGVWGILWTGDRLPVPGRDSLLVLAGDGGWYPAALTGWWEGWAPCVPVPGERDARIRIEGTIPGRPVLVRLFEQGSYSFHNRAFRWERGQGGRQPLTPELFAGGSRFELLGAGEFMLRAEFTALPGVAGGGGVIAFPFRIDP